MFANPRFNASLDVQTAGARLLFLLDEHRQAVMEGEVYSIIAPLLDGRRTIADIVAGTKDAVSLADIYAALARLESRGYLVDGSGVPAGERNAFFEYARPGQARQAAPARTAMRFALRTVGNVNGQAMQDALLANGFELDPAGEGELMVVVTDDYLRPDLDAINRERLASGRPWMLVKPVGVVVWVGPIFDPARTGCWSCLAQRLQANRQMEKYILDHQGSSEPIVTALGSLPSTEAVGHQLAASQIAEWLVRNDGAPLLGRLATLDLASRRLERHTLVKRPQCRDCGDRQLLLNDETHPPRFAHCSKRFRGDGGHRVLTPEETFERYRHHISPLLGAVTELLPAIGPPSELTHSFVAGHNFSMGVDGVVFLRESLRGMSGGKGTTRIQAMVSGLCEAIERYSGIYTGDEYTVRGTYAELRDKAIHPNACMGFSEQQFARRREWNSSQPNSRCHLVPEPFDENRATDWSALWSLSAQQYRYLPTAYCYYGHPEFRASKWCAPDSNGSAAGNTVEEALLQGFMELVERDSVALWWYNRIRRRGVDLESFHEPYLDAIRDHYRSLGRDLWVLDITSDLQIPTFACISRRTDRPVEDVLLGFGAHFDPRVALLRAITEVNQFLPSVSLTNRDGSTRYLFGDELAQAWWRTARVEEHPYLPPDPERPPATASEYENRASSDLLADIDTCVEIADRHGLEMLVLDQTRPDIGLSVVKVVVPELCHFWRRLGKRRLYEVPVRMGWRETPAQPNELNPYSIFF